jgi:hypothetical protein
MSIDVMTRVWQHSRHKGTELLLLLAIADNANHAGVAWPSIAHLAAKTRLSERAVVDILHRLEATGELRVNRNVGRGKSNVYCVIEPPPPEQAGKGEEPAPFPSSAAPSRNGEEAAPFPGGKGEDGAGKGADPARKGAIQAGKGADWRGKGAACFTPTVNRTVIQEPSGGTVREPSRVRAGEGSPPALVACPVCSEPIAGTGLGHAGGCGYAGLWPARWQWLEFEGRAPPATLRGRAVA